MVEEKKLRFRHRKSDNLVIFRLWERIGPYWHVGTTALVAFIAGVMWIHDVSGYGDRITTLEVKMQDLPVIRQRVEDIANFMGVPKGRGNGQ